MASAKCSPGLLGNEGAWQLSHADADASALHRLGKVRRQEGISRGTVARRLGIDVAAVKLQEQRTSDVPLSVLYEWQKVLEVPLTELLAEPNESLSPSLVKRAQLVRIMKTALSIREGASQEPVRRLAQTMVNQLNEIMPELEGVNPWHTVGKQRRRDEYGQAAERCLPDDMFVDEEG